jgi:cyanophycinase-like exopeptidase
MKLPSEEIQKLFRQRKQLRKEKKFADADKIRVQLESLGYTITDDMNQTTLSSKNIITHSRSTKQYVVLFGSGEISSIGRSVYEYVFKKINKKQIKISIITTPAGFQPNVIAIHEEIADFFKKSLINYHPEVNIVYGNNLNAANEESTFQALDETNIIFMGPGSPTYAVLNLQHSLLLEKIVKCVNSGASLILSSAAVLACSEHTLPVYEIFKVGSPLHWVNGLNILSKYTDESTYIPHWNNTEGMPKLDTSCCYMGNARFAKLRKLINSNDPIYGIDEQTAMVIECITKNKTTIGKGSVHKI